MKWFNRFRQPQPQQAVVLMYHRVADVIIDPWELAVSPINFENQLRLLKKKYTVLSVEELLHLVPKNKIPRKSICITFDDGYTDNYTFARPALETNNLPATFFIPTHYAGLGAPFWWDALGTILLETPRLPQLFQMSINGNVIASDLGTEALLGNDLLEKHKSWVWTQAAPTKRCALYLQLWKQLQPLPYHEIQTIMAAIKAWAGYTFPIQKAGLPMDKVQLNDLSRNTLFQLGMHTVTHPALAFHSLEVQHQEIALNKNALQGYGSLNAIAFPYGSYNNDTLLNLQELGITAGFTTQERPVTSSSNMYCLGRYQVKNWDASTFEKKLQQWFQP